MQFVVRWAQRMAVDDGFKIQDELASLICSSLYSIGRILPTVGV
jgi:hypothetical protein